MRLDSIAPWWRRNSENAAAVLLAVAALATAWSGYQASVWGGIQASNYTLSSVLRGKAALAHDDIARSRLVDVALFTRWIEADTDNNRKIRDIYERHFRPEFRAAFLQWRRKGVAELERTTPFDDPGYKSPRSDEAARYEAEAWRTLQAGEHANKTSDRYIFITVILATVLFFAGAIRPVIAPAFRMPVLCLATLLCVWAIGALVSAPIAR